MIHVREAGTIATEENRRYVTIYADTTADMPDPAEHPEWEVGSELIVMENGGQKYRLNNAGEWAESSFDAGGGGVTEEYVSQKIAEAQLSGGEVDLSAYPTESKVETMIDNEIAAVRQEAADSQINTENDIAALQNDATTLRLDCDNLIQDMEQVRQEQTQLADDVEEIKTKTTATAFPRQDASVEGIWMKYAEYVFPQETNYESTDLIMLVRNRVVSESPELGILAARLRYSSNSGTYQFYSLRWMPNLIGIDMNKFAMCVNDAEGKAELYVRCDSTYYGYVFTALAMGTGTNVYDMTAWLMEDATEGVSELPTADSGWTTIYSQA